MRPIPVPDAMSDQRKAKVGRHARTAPEQQPAADPRTAQVARAIEPRMRALEEYLSELARTLNAAPPDVRVAYTIEGYGVLADLRQRDYRVHTGEGAPLDRVQLRFECRGQERVQFFKETREDCETQRHYLVSHGLQFQHTDRAQWRWLFVMEPIIPVIFDFHVDVSKGVVRLDVTNLYRLGVAGYNYAPSQLNEEFFQELATCVLRKPSRFDELSGNSVSDDVRRQFRHEIAVRRRQRELELGDKKPEAAGGGRNFLKGLFKRKSDE